ncbi:MAG TPA: hypothetical protein VMU58_05740 [Gaiellaceae bacterium]|nr:hypothetical protein [Gaiellaceae bacterium]
MRRLFAWLAGAAGGLAAYRALKRNRVAPEPAGDTRAEELKARLAQARETVDDGEELEPGEVAVDEAEQLDPQARRAHVHEQGRAALDEMRRE